MLSSSIIKKCKEKSACRSELMLNLCAEINNVPEKEKRESQESQKPTTTTTTDVNSLRVVPVLENASSEVTLIPAFTKNAGIRDNQEINKSPVLTVHHDHDYSSLEKPEALLEDKMESEEIFVKESVEDCPIETSRVNSGTMAKSTTSLVMCPSISSKITTDVVEYIVDVDGNLLPVQEPLRESTLSVTGNEVESDPLRDNGVQVYPVGLHAYGNKIVPVVVNEEESVPVNADDIEIHLVDDFEPIATCSTLQTTGELTKTGELRKRRKFLLSPNERASVKISRIKSQHFVKEVCKCKKRCTSVISEDQRIKINEQYWNLSRNEQKSFIIGGTNKKPVQRKTAGCASRRTDTVEYFLKDEQGYSKKVCKVFFLSTLGYSKNNDSIIQSMCKQTGISPRVDGRKGKIPHNKIDKTLIQEHINSFQPSISHYRREHAPNRLYLPSDLTITKMYNDFGKSHPRFSCSYDLYREEVNKMNISFIKLGHEECEFCEHFEQHPHSLNESDPSCNDCQEWKLHIDRATAAREMYHEDKTKELREDEIIYSVDLQKVIMLPRLDMFKNVVFSHRLSVYNETFAPVGSKSKSNIVPIIWHEAIRGRKKEDIVSAVFKFLSCSEARDAKCVVFWMDNCSSQNKNWTLFTFFVYIVNSCLISADAIVVKYFEPGHTFMSADSFHHSVEKSMKTNKQSKVYDFSDFQEAVTMASKKVNVLTMQLEDFCQWKSFVSLKKVKNSSSDRPYLKDIVTIEAKRGSLQLLYKKAYREEWNMLDFLQIKITKSGKIPAPNKQERPRGISVTRKGSLLQLLKGRSSVIPGNRLEFWHSLPLTSNEGRDDVSDCDDF